MGKNVVLKADIDYTKSVVAKVVYPNGTVVDLKHCGVPNALREKKHMNLVSPIDVKRKPKGQFAVEFVCLGAHHADFEPLTVFIEAQRKGSSERIRSELFTVIGSRDEKRIKYFADNHNAPQQPIPLTIQNHEIAGPRANPPPTTSLENLLTEELTALSQNSADPGYQVQAENSDIQDISTKYLDDEDPYVDFTCSRFAN